MGAESKGTTMTATINTQGLKAWQLDNAKAKAHRRVCEREGRMVAGNSQAVRVEYGKVIAEMQAAREGGKS